jgi:hypothetical protein
MKQILINSNIENLAKNYKNNFSVKKQDIVNSLEDLKNKYTNHDEILYLNNIINNYDKIIIAKPSEIVSKWIGVFGVIPDYEYEDKCFYKSIVDAMRYNDVRSIYFIKFLKEFEINCCIYCHMQSTLITEILYKRTTPLEDGTIKMRGDLRKYKAFLELDHFYSKSEFPFLSTSFYNLYPVCSNCNKSKAKKKIDYFDFYIDDIANEQKFQFYITEESKVKYLTSNNREDFEIKLSHPNKEIKNNYNNDFNIELTYNKQKDIVEELFFKQKQYTKIYKESVEDILDMNSTDEYMFKRIILGNYFDEKDIHKRPLAKFYQDIAKNLKLFK